MMTQQNGYASILLIALILIGIFIFAFVVEVGELLIVNAQAEHAAEAGAHAASFALGEVVVIEVGEGKTIPIIRNDARVAAENAAQIIVLQNGAEFVPPIEYPDPGNDFMVKVTVKKTFTPFFDKLINRTFEFKKSAQSKANIKKGT